MIRPMNKKKILLIAIALIIILFASVIAVTEKKITFPPVSTNTQHGEKIPEGWKRYQNAEWGFAFNYPESWTIKENFLTKEATMGSNRKVGEFNGVTLSGGGYVFQFDIGGHELPSKYNYTHPEYVIAGNRITTSKYENGTEFGLFINIPVKNPVSKVRLIGIRVTNSDASTKYTPVIDEVLSSVEVQ